MYIDHPKEITQLKRFNLYFEYNLTELDRFHTKVLNWALFIYT